MNIHEVDFQKFERSIEEKRTNFEENNNIKFLFQYICNTISFKEKVFTLSIKEFMFYISFDLHLLKPSDFYIFLDKCEEQNLLKIDDNEVIIKINGNGNENILMNFIKNKDNFIKNEIDSIINNESYTFLKLDDNGIIFKYVEKGYYVRLNFSTSFEKKYGKTSCDCLGWKYHHNCRHAKELYGLIYEKMSKLEKIYNEMKEK